MVFFGKKKIKKKERKKERKKKPNKEITTRRGKRTRKQ